MLKQSTKKDNSTIAYIKHSDTDKKYFNLIKNTDKYTDSEIDKLKINVPFKIRNALIEDMPPKDEEEEKLYYKCIELLNKNKKCGFRVSKEEEIQQLPFIINNITPQKLLIVGVSGSGKSTYASHFITEYKKKYKKNEFFLISGVEEDKVLDELDPIRVDLENLMVNPINDYKEIKDSVILFDDTSTIKNAKCRKYVQALLDDLLETHRHFNITLIITQHQFSNYHVSRRMLNEISSTTWFNKSSNIVQLKKYLKAYHGLSEDQITKLTNINSRWITLFKTYPNIVMSQREIFIL